MFAVFLIACIVLVLLGFIMRIGIVRLRYLPILGVMAGGLLGLAYNGSPLQGAAAGFISAIGFLLVFRDWC